MPNSVKETVVFNLLSREIRPIANWKEWLDRWQAAVTYQELLGLLHCGFDVALERAQYGETEYDGFARLVFYFGIADGWLDDTLLRLPQEGYESCYVTGYDQRGNKVGKTSAELRQQLARKAMDMLCVNFFKMSLHEDLSPPSFGWQWLQIVLSPKLFPVILHFFRAEKEKFGKGVDIRNLRGWERKSHSEETIIEFLLKLTRFLWGYEDGHVSDDYSHDTNDIKRQKEKLRREVIEIRERIDSSKPWMIEVLAMLKRTDVLSEWLLKLDKACLRKLGEIALRKNISSHYVSKSRPVKNLEEACLVNSPCAWLLKEYDLKVSEIHRLTKIQQAEENKERAEQELKKLQKD